MQDPVAPMTPWSRHLWQKLMIFIMSTLMWLTWKAANDRDSNIVETSERLLSCWHTLHVINTVVVQSTVIREREWAVRVLWNNRVYRYSKVLHKFRIRAAVQISRWHNVSQLVLNMKYFRLWPIWLLVAHCFEFGPTGNSAIRSAYPENHDRIKHEVDRITTCGDVAIWIVPIESSVGHHRLRGSGSTVVTMTSKVNGKTEISTSCRSETP